MIVVSSVMALQQLTSRVLTGKEGAKVAGEKAPMHKCLSVSATPVTMPLIKARHLAKPIARGWQRALPTMEGAKNGVR